MLKGFWSYTGFEKPVKIGDTFEELFKNTEIYFNTLAGTVEVENNLKDDLTDLLNCLNLSSFYDLEHEDINSVLFSYNIYYNPTVEDFKEFNKTICLRDYEYLEDLI